MNGNKIKSNKIAVIENMLLNMAVSEWSQNLKVGSSGNFFRLGSIRKLFSPSKR